MGAGFCEDLGTFRTRPADDLDALRGRNVEYHDRLVEKRGKRREPLDRLNLCKTRMALSEDRWRGQTFGKQALNHEVDHCVIFGVRTNKRTVVARSFKNVEDLVIVKLERIV